MHEQQTSSQPSNPLESPSQPLENQEENELESGTPGQTSSEREESKLDELGLSKKWNALTMQERKLRERETHFKTEKEKYDAIASKYENLKTNPMEVLREAGWDLKKLADLVLNDEKPTTEQKLQTLEEQILEERESRKREKTEAEEARKRALEQEQQAVYDQTVAKAKKDIDDIVSGSDEFELIRDQGAQELVWNVMQEVWRETKQVIDIKEAALKVEGYLEDEVEKIMKAQKFQSRYKPVPPKEEEIDLGHNFYMKKMLEEKYGRGLSNDMVSDGARVPEEKEVYLTDDERKARVAKRLQATLQASRNAK